MMSVLQKLLSYPHKAVFDVAPAGELAFRISGPAQCRWSIADEVMAITDGTTERNYDLNQFTVGQLAQQLTMAGFAVDYLSAQFVGMSALVLAEGSGDQFEAGGTDINGFKNELWSLFGAFGKEVREARRQVTQALRQMLIPQSETEWLDLHGTLYDQARGAGQSDADFAEAIPREAFRVRVNAIGIEQAIFDATGKVVTIEEPWELMFRLSESKLGGPQRFYDGNLVGPCLIQPSSKQPIDWSDVLPIINRNKAAGVIVLEPVSRPRSFVSGGLDGTCLLGMTAIHADIVRTQGEDRLDFISLSNEYPYARNFGVSISLNFGTGTGENLCPVSASYVAYSFAGVTWLYAQVWGPFTWNGGQGTEFIDSNCDLAVGVGGTEIDYTHICEIEDVSFVIGEDGYWTSTTEWLEDGEFHDGD